VDRLNGISHITIKSVENECICLSPVVASCGNVIHSVILDLVSLNAAMMHNIAFPVPGITSPNHARAYPYNAPLNEVELGGGNVERIDISGKAGEGLLGAVWSDEGVDLDAVDVVLLLKSGSDLALVGLDIADEDEGVVLLDLDQVISLYASSCVHRGSRTFFMADSVLSGWIRTLEASMRGAWGTDLRGYLGARDSSRVLGL
jgi:hypothetical protein